jgi:acetylornithine/succinyldiaminopimelate/putrescine aminotransferase
MNIDHVSLEKRHAIPTYAQIPVLVVRGEGCRVFDEKGASYLDFWGGHAVALTGHCHPRVVAAVREQAGRLLFYSNVVFNDVRARALASLAAAMPKGMSRAFLCNSGSEANESAIKTARRTTGRREVISMHGGFHGRTMGSLSATPLGHYLDDYAPGVPDHRFLPFGDLDALRAAVTERTAAVMFEPVQSMGGVASATDEYVRGVRAVCDAVGALLIFDEIQTGLGRTGVMWYGDAAGVVPDIITTAKGLASGVPIGAMLAKDEVSAKVKEGDQGTTFGGGPLACAAMEATLAVIRDERLVENAARRGREIVGGVTKIRGVTGVRGRGLLLGIVLDREAKGVVKALREKRRVIAGGTSDPNVLRILPPLVVGDAEVAEFVAALADVMKG